MSAPGAARLLLVEDNELNRDMLARRLRRRGFEVDHAADGQEAIERTRSWQPDLVLMDMSLPVMDGYAATAALKADPATADVPVIALTANAMAGDEQRCRAAGCDDYATKPTDLPRLLEQIEALLPAGRT